MKAATTAWEESYGRPFLVDDVRYIDTIEDQWADYKLSRESEKTQKVFETLLCRQVFSLLFFFPVEEGQRRDHTTGDEVWQSSHHTSQKVTTSNTSMM